MQRFREPSLCHGPWMSTREFMFTSPKAAESLGISLEEFDLLCTRLKFVPDRTGKNKWGNPYCLWRPHRVETLRRFLEGSKS